MCVVGWDRAWWTPVMMPPEWLRPSRPEKEQGLDLPGAFRSFKKLGLYL